MLFEREESLRQRLYAASLAPLDPYIYFRHFDPESLPDNEQSDNAPNFQQPQSLDELESMLAEWEAMDSLNALATPTLPEQI